MKERDVPHHELPPPPFAALSVMSLALLSRDKRAMVRFMGHNKGRNNARKRAKRRKKTERLALVKKKLPVEVRQQIMPWPGILPGVTTGKYDMAVTAVLVTPERTRPS